MEHVHRNYLPAAGSDWALPLYDPLVKLLGADRARRKLLELATLQPGDRVLDVGCGTGTFATLIRQLHPTIHVVGLDPDPKALDLARRKVNRHNVELSFDQGFGHNLPYADASFEHVFSSFMFHHLQADVKEKTLCEVRRVLAPGGSLHLLDFERSESGGILARHLARHHLKDNSESRIFQLLRQAGFRRAMRVSGGTMLFGLLSFGYYQASVPV